MSEMTNNINTRCVVLTPREGVEAAYKIVQRLDLQADIEHCPLLAMAELALLHQLRRNDAAWNSAPQPTLLVLINTDKMEFYFFSFWRGCSTLSICRIAHIELTTKDTFLRFNCCKWQWRNGVARHLCTDDHHRDTDKEARRLELH